MFELYRSGALGMALADTLDGLVEHEQLTGIMAMRVLYQFDKTISETLSTRVKNKATIKSGLDTYRFCDDVWTFMLLDSTIKLDDEIIQIPKLKIVACNSKTIEK